MLYTVQEAFKLLQEYKITSHKESVRRWLREGKIKGISPKTRKEGWMIEERDLLDFVQSRMPNSLIVETPNTTFDVKEIDPREIRETMWWELVSKNIFEGMLEVKKTQVRDCITHLRLSKEFEAYAWNAIKTHKRGYAAPRIPYLLEAALFEDQRIVLNTTYETKEEQILFGVLEYIRKQRVNI